MTDLATYAAFADEMSKISGALTKNVGNWISHGWHDAGVLGGAKATWMGKGKMTRFLPIGEKSLMAASTASMVPSVVKKEDPFGRGRSRAERGTGLVASTLGGLAGAGALMGAPGSRFRATRALIGGVAGSIGAERLATTPFRKARLEAAKPIFKTPDERAALLQYAMKGEM